jgi:hypothetical protein
LPGDFNDENDFSKFGINNPGSGYGDEDDDEVVGEL